MATHSSTLAWRTPWTEEPGGLQSMGSQRVGRDWVTSPHLTIWDLWYLHMNFSVIFSISVKNVIGILNCTECIDHFGCYGFFNITVSSSWTQDIFLLVFHLISFTNVFDLQYTSLSSLLLSVFLFFSFSCYCKWDCFLNSFR